LEYLVLRQAVVVVPEVYENGVALRRRYWALSFVTMPVVLLAKRWGSARSSTAVGPNEPQELFRKLWGLLLSTVKFSAESSVGVDVVRLIPTINLYPWNFSQT
jgi:hypothetical protein